MADEVKEKIVKIIQKESGVSFDEIDSERDFREQVNLDSMQYVAIVARIEHELDVELPITVMEVSSINSFIDVVKKAVKKKGKK